MATWIAHLRIAENLLGMIPGLDPHSFVVGSVAPDSGIPDEKWEKFTPPGEVTHFRAPKGSLYPSADKEFYRQHLADAPFPGSDPKKASFLFGYFCHLVTDNLWHAMISVPTRERYQVEFGTIPGFVWEVKKDWYGLDFEYVRSHPDSLYWRVFLVCDYPINYLEFLIPEGVRQSLAHIQEYYQRQDAHAEERVNRQRLYLTEPEMSHFVETATRTLLESWQRLQAGEIQTEGMVSVLESIR
jgi:hypothetical protein